MAESRSTIAATTSPIRSARRTADGGGVAAAFDAVGGASWETSWRSLGDGGTLVGYGFQDFLESGGASAEAGKAMPRFGQGMNAEGAEDGTRRRTMFYDIRERRQLHPDDYRADAGHLLAMIAAGDIVLPPAEVLPLADAAEAHRRVAAAGLQRRIVLRP